MFEVDKELSEKIMKKYGSIKMDVYEESLGPCKILIQSRIAKEFLKISEEEVKSHFKQLGNIFIETCYSYEIPCKPLDILLITDDEIDRGLLSVMQRKDDNSLWGYIFIPTIHLEIQPYYSFVFLHELGHCWINIPFKRLEPYEIFVDLVAICTLKKIIPTHKKIYREIIKRFTYVGGEGGQIFCGKGLQKTILQNPESYLKSSLKEIGIG